MEDLGAKEKVIVSMATTDIWLTAAWRIRLVLHCSLNCFGELVSYITVKIDP